MIVPFMFCDECGSATRLGDGGGPSSMPEGWFLLADGDGRTAHYCRPACLREIAQRIAATARPTDRPQA